MGAQFSKTAGKEGTAAENPGEVSVSPSKANGQKNGHLKLNGDASPAAAEQKEEVQTNGTATAEDGKKDKETPAEKEATDGDKPNTEVIALTEQEAAKAEDGATPSTSNETPKKKKKRFSFKKSFKLSGFSFKKTKETGDNGEKAVAAGSDEAKTDGAVKGVPEEKAQTTEEAAKPEQNTVEETKVSSPASEESEKEEKAAEPAVVTEPSPS